MPDTKNEIKHIAYLDSLRGIAALSVVFYHFINWKYEKETGAILASFIFNGSDAVSFFFVLSGFVLSYKYIVLKKDLDIRKFYINRFFRLWPAFFLIVFINALYWYRGNLNLPYLTDQFVFNKRQFWEEASLIRPHPYYFGPSWTLVIELTLSLMVPYLIVLGQRSYKVLICLACMFYLIGNNMGVWIMYQVHFVFGVLLSCLYLHIGSDSFRQTKWYKNRHWLLVLAILLFSIRHIDRLFPFGKWYEYIVGTYLGLDFFQFTAIASFIFLVLVISSDKAKKALQWAPLQWLGKMAYGIYLTHWLYVTYIFDHWAQLSALFPGFWAAFISLLLACIVATFVSAAIIHYAVELPFIKIGKRLTDRMKPGFTLKSD